MKQGICLLSSIPVRIRPDDKSELTTQLLWCEMFYILEQKKNWVFIQSVSDNYEGWISENQVTYVAQKDFEKLINSTTALAGSLISFAKDLSADIEYPVTAGADLLNFDKNNISFLNRSFIFEGDVIIAKEEQSPVDNAMLFLGVPYLWGGRSAMGIDCSGLTQIAYKMAGINIARDSKEQAKSGIQVDFLEEALPCDLLFFGEKKKGAIIHVGMLTKQGNIIHAHGKVRLDKVDQHGIYDEENKKYTHFLRLIKRII